MQVAGGRCGRGFGGALPALAGLLHLLVGVGADKPPRLFRAGHCRPVLGATRWGAGGGLSRLRWALV